MSFEALCSTMRELTKANHLRYELSSGKIRNFYTDFEGARILFKQGMTTQRMGASKSGNYDLLPPSHPNGAFVYRIDLEAKITEHSDGIDNPVQRDHHIANRRSALMKAIAGAPELVPDHKPLVAKSLSTRLESIVNTNEILVIPENRYMPAVAFVSQKSANMLYRAGVHYQSKSLSEKTLTQLSKSYDLSVFNQCVPLKNIFDAARNKEESAAIYDLLQTVGKPKEEPKEFASHDQERGATQHQPRVFPRAEKKPVLQALQKNKRQEKEAQPDIALRHNASRETSALIGAIAEMIEKREIFVAPAAGIRPITLCATDRAAKALHEGRVLTTLMHDVALRFLSEYDMKKYSHMLAPENLVKATALTEVETADLTALIQEAANITTQERNTQKTAGRR